MDPDGKPCRASSEGRSAKGFRSAGGPGQRTRRLAGRETRTVKHDVLQVKMVA